MLSLPYNKLTILPQKRYYYKNREIKFTGFDTETKDGLCRLICTSDATLVPASIDEILQFLITHCHRKIGVFYNLNYDFQAILKWLPVEKWIELHDTEKIVYNEYILKYIKDKFLIIKYHNRKYYFYDISQFYSKKSLAYTAKKYLNMEKTDPGIDLSDIPEYMFSVPEFQSYCKNDSLLAEKLAYHFYEICKSMHLKPTRFSSPAAISIRYFANACDIPTINELEPALLEYAYNSTSGAFIEVFKRGYFPKTFNYDINSAYPASIAQLIDYRLGDFIFSKRTIPDGAHIGFMHVKINSNYSDRYSYHSPFILQNRNKVNYFPVGYFKTYITLDEYNAYCNDFEIDIIDGWYFIPFILQFPFKEKVEYLYNIRKNCTDDSLKLFLKIALNGMYGKFLEKNLNLDTNNIETGNYFNPLYASHILAQTRIKIYNFLKSLDFKDIISVQTDGVFCLKDIPIYTKDMGMFSNQGEHELLQIGSGVYTLKYANTVQTKLRGFKTTDKVDLFKILYEQYTSDSIKLDTISNISYNIVIKQKRYLERNIDYQDMNKLLEGIKRIDINFDTKRIWDRSFHCAGDILSSCIDSQPLPYI